MEDTVNNGSVVTQATRDEMYEGNPVDVPVYVVDPDKPQDVRCPKDDTLLLSKEQVANPATYMRMDKTFLMQMESLQKQQRSSASTLKALRDKPHKLRAGIDYWGDRLWYGFSPGGRDDDGKNLHFITSAFGHFKHGKDLPPGLDAERKLDIDLPFSAEAINRYLAGKYPVDGADLISRTADFIRERAIFQDPNTPWVLALWVIGTYLYMAFPAYPYLWLTSPTENSGKTTAMDLLNALSFRSPDNLSVSTSDAALFREVNHLGHTIFMDEFEPSKYETDNDKWQLYNGGYRLGSVVKRTGGDGYGRIDTFHVYSPKVFAGISREVPKTFESRCINVSMIKKLPGDKIIPFNLKEEKPGLQPLRDAMAVWALTNAPTVYGWSSDEKLRSGLVPDVLTNRDADIFRPLFAIAKAAHAEMKLLVDFAERFAGSHKNEAEDNSPARILRFLRDWFQRQGTSAEARFHSGTIALQVSTQLAGEGLPTINEKAVGQILRGLGLEVEQIKIDGVGKKGIEISRARLDDLCSRYGVAE